MRKWLDVLNVAALSALWAETLAAILLLPPTVPTSFSGGGGAQAFGSKYTLLLMPAIASFVFAIVWFAAKGSIQVTGVRFAPDRYDEAQETGRFYLRIVRLVIVLGVAFIQWTVIASARDGHLSSAFGVAIGAFSVALVGTIGLMIVRLSAFGERHGR